MNKKSFSKMISLVTCAVLMLVTLGGCQQSSNSSADEAMADKTAPTDEHEPITILTGSQKYEEFAKLLEEKYPEVNLEFVSFCGGDSSRYMYTSLQQGDIPDIYTITYVPGGDLQKENLLDLANYSMINEYADTMLDTLDVDGAIYLLPSRYSLIGIVYNKTIMEENGWKVPESFEEFTALAEDIKAAGYEVTNVKTSLTGTTFGTFFALGNTNYFSTPEGAKWKTDFLNDDATAVGSLEGVADYFQKWIDAGFIDTYYYDNPDASADSDFDNRKGVFQIYSNRLAGENTTDEYGFMPFLSEDGSNNMLVRLVSRYYGLNKELGEEGNEQKLEDALKVLEVMSTQEGQEALATGSSSFISSTSINDLPEDSPFQDVLELINQGNMVDMVYSGWEDYIVPLIEDYGNEWIDGTMTSTDFLQGMDTLNQQIQSGEFKEVLGTASGDISLEDTARLCAIAEGKATGADVAIISTPAFHGFSEGANLENRQGVHCGIFEGEITKVALKMYAPGSADILTVKMTGDEIQKLVETGFEVEGDPTPFDYCMVTKNDMELEGNKEYVLAVGIDELSQSDLIDRAEATGIVPLDAIASYISELGTVNTDAIVWE